MRVKRTGWLSLELTPETRGDLAIAFVGRSMRRFWWGPLAVGWLRIPFHEFCAVRFSWIPESERK
jgi:hypothetical protein